MSQTLAPTHHVAYLLQTVKSKHLEMTNSHQLIVLSENRNPIDYVHWNDSNELVDRLCLLVSSQTAGHTGHNNEIASVLEELRESEIIE